MLCFSSDKTSTNPCARISFCEFALAHLIFGLCTSPTGALPFTYHSFNGRAILMVEDFQRLIFVNIQSSNMFEGKYKSFSHLTSSQESLKQRINIYIYISYNLWGQRHIPIYPQTSETPLLDSYSYPVTCTTHIRTFCLTTIHPLNTLQQNLSTLLLQDVAKLINIGRTHILFDHAVFKTDLFLNYKETMGTFCGTNLNPLSQLL